MPEFVAPDRESVIAETIAAHPDINTRDEDSPGGRARILDYAIERLNREHRANPIEGAFEIDPWGRKARQRIDPSDPTTGINLNTDGLTLLLAGGRKFEIMDVIDGTSGKSSWHNYGAFLQGENGYWAPGIPITNDRPTPGPVPRPQPKPEDPPREVIVFREKPPALDYGQQMALSVDIIRELTSNPVSPYRNRKGTSFNFEAIGQVVSHLVWKVQEEGYPVSAAIDNARRRARGEQGDE